MTSSIPQPDEKIQPVRVIPQLEAHQQEARAGGVEDLVEFRAFYTREVVLFGAIAGPRDGEPIILLHGFPDFWLGWARQIRPLVEAGYRVIIPDQRGYNRSEKPRDVDAYRMAPLGADIVDVLDAADIEKAHLVGHDWGGALSWWLADHYPERFKTLTVLNCPHSVVMGKALMGKNPRQMLRSWYIALFQIPHLPEMLAKAGNYRLLEAALEMSDDDSFSADELEMYRRAWSQDGAVRSMINWYRAARREMFDDEEPKVAPSPGKIAAPTRIIWGKNDKALDTSLVEPSAARCRRAHIDWVDDASHWVQRDRPELVAEKMLEHFQA